MVASSGGAVVASSGTAVATKSNSGPVSGIANVGIRRAEIKQGECVCVCMHVGCHMFVCILLKVNMKYYKL